MFSYSQKTYGPKNTRVVIIFGWWGARQWHLFLLGQLLSSYHFKAIIYTYDSSILTSDIALTAKRFAEVYEDALTTIHDLPKKEQHDIAVMGISQGTILAFMLANATPRITRLIANLSGSDLADIVWSWDRVIKEFKKQLGDQKITLRKLKNAWHDLAPHNNLDNLADTQVLLYMTRNDEVIPFIQQKLLLDELRSQGTKVEAMINTRHKHFLSGVINLLKFDVYITFLKKKKK